MKDHSMADLARDIPVIPEVKGTEFDSDGKKTI